MNENKAIDEDKRIYLRDRINLNNTRVSNEINR